MRDVIVAFAASFGGLIAVRYGLAEHEARHRRHFELRFPRDFTGDDALAVIAGLSGLLPGRWARLLHQPAAVLDIEATERGVRHLLCVPARRAPYVASQLWASRIRPVAVEPAPITVGLACELRRVDPLSPLATDASSISAGVLAALQPLRAGEAVRLQWVIAPVARGLISSDNALLALADLITGQRSRGRQQADLRMWDREPAFVASLRAGATAPRSPRRRQLLGQVLGALQRTRTGGPSFRRRGIPSALVTQRVADGRQPVLEWPCLLRASELAAVIAFPVGNPVLPGVTTGGCRPLTADMTVPRTGRVLGRSNFPGSERPVAIRPREVMRHCLVTGPTGVGKSTLLLNAILADIAAGFGTCVLDPKGDLVSDVLDRLPARVADQVILLDPSDTERPVGFNLLRGPGSSSELVVDGLVRIFRELARGSWGPRLEDVLRSALTTLTLDPTMTLLELEPLLVDPTFRARLLRRLDDPIALEPFWASYESLTDGERGQWIAPVLNKIRPFSLRRTVRRVIGQSASTFQLNEVLDRGLILLVALPSGLLGEDAARLLGTALLGQLWQAVLGRAAVPQATRRPFSVFVDEWPVFAALPTSIGEALAQSRGMNVAWCLAGQHLSQVPSTLREEALANAVTKVCFQLAATDARLFARELAPNVAAEDLQGLAAYEAIVRPAVDGGVAPPLTIDTLPAPPSNGTGPAARLASRQRYGTEAAEVDAQLRARREGPTPEGPIKRRRRA